MRSDCAGIEFIQSGANYICIGPRGSVIIETRRNKKWQEMGTLPMCWYIVVGDPEEGRIVVGPYEDKREAEAKAVYLVSE